IERRVLEAIRHRQRVAVEVEDQDERQAAVKWAMQSESRTRRDYLLSCAATIRTIAVEGDHWDARPLLFGVRNGVIDLETGRLRAGHPDDAITKVAPVTHDPYASCPRFARFLAELFASQPELVSYMQRVFGYTLTGLTREQ